MTAPGPQQRERFAEQKQEAVDLYHCVGFGIVQTARDTVRCTLDQYQERFQRFPLSGPRTESGLLAESGLLVFFLKAFVTQIVEAKQGCVSAEVLRYELCGFSIDSCQSFQKFSLITEKCCELLVGLVASREDGGLD